MTTVLGFDMDHNARAVEVSGSKKNIQKMLEAKGWTNLIFLES